MLTPRYLYSGIAQSYVEHENGHRKIVSFHGSGTVFPGYHQHDYNNSFLKLCNLLYLLLGPQAGGRKMLFKIRGKLFRGTGNLRMDYFLP